MLAKKYRLELKHKERMQGKRLVSDSFLVVTKPNFLPHKRVAFIVSKKLYKNAVDRNRLKRQLRHAVKEVVESGSGDFLIIARGPVKRLTFDEMRAELKGLMGRY